MRKMNLSQAYEKNFNALIDTLKLHDITVECKKPENFMKFSEDFSRQCHFNYLFDLFEIETKSKKTVGCAAYIYSQYASIYPEYSRFIESNLHVLRDLMGTFSILDIDGLCLVSWKNDKQYVDENLEGFSYSLPYIYSPYSKKYNHNYLRTEDLIRFYSICEIDERVSNYFINDVQQKNCVNLYPYYATFSVHQKFPVKYGFCSSVNEESYNFINTFYYDYVDINLLLNCMKKYFNESFCIIQLSTTSHETFSFEIGMLYTQYNQIINDLIADEQFVQLCGNNVKDLSIPNFISNIIFKFKWENKTSKTLKVYLEVNDEKMIDQILF